MSDGNSDTHLLKEYGGAVVLAIVVALFIRFFILEVYRVPSTAMRPTLEAGDTIFVSKFAYGFRLPGAENPLFRMRSPERGEVVVASFPQDPSREFVKRVIGVPGDRVEIRAGKIIVNGTVLGALPTPIGCGTEELPGGLKHGFCQEPPELESHPVLAVPPDQVYLMGDLRTGVEGSGRKIKNNGLTPKSLLKGRVLRIWISSGQRSPEESGGFGWWPRVRWDRFFRRVE